MSTLSDCENCIPFRKNKYRYKFYSSARLNKNSKFLKTAYPSPKNKYRYKFYSSARLNRTQNF